MKMIRVAFGLSILAAMFGSTAVAQQRTFVSGLGNDANPCSRTAPCRTFGQAISQTNAGGEVVVLDSAGYGPVTITKSISLVSPPGVYAGISVFSGDGIDINAGASDVVILRGLAINNQGSNGSGIAYGSGAELHVENCFINGFSSFYGLGFFVGGKLEVRDSTLRGNENGIVVWPQSGTALAEIDHVRLEANSQEGLLAREGAVVTVRNSSASGNARGFEAGTGVGAVASVRLNLQGCSASNNSQFGILAQGVSMASIDVNVEGCVVSGNSTGIDSQTSSTGTATVRVSDSTVTDNSTGLVGRPAPAALLSRGNNTVEGNGQNTSGTIGSYSAK